MNPSSRRRVRRAGSRPAFPSTRPSYSRGGGSRPRPTARAGRPARRRLPRPTLQLPSLPVVRVRWLSASLIGVAIIIILVLAGHATALKAIKVQGNQALTTAHVTQLADAGLDQQWLGHNTLLVDTGALASYLTKTEPGISQVAIHRSGLHTLAIRITERQPTLNWKTGGTSYLLDAHATVIGPTTAAYAHLPTVTDSSNLPVKVGQRVAPTQFVVFCTQLAQLLPGAGYQLSALTVPETTSEVYATTNTGLTLKFDTTRSAGEEVADLSAVTAHLNALHQKPSQYIDLRIAGKAYYQ